LPTFADVHNVLGFAFWIEAFALFRFTLTNVVRGHNASDAVFKRPRWLLHEPHFDIAVPPELVPQYFQSFNQRVDRDSLFHRWVSVIRLAILQRRMQVAELLLKGLTQAAIAQKLGVKQPTVCDDLIHIRKLWQESQIRDFDAERTLQVERLRQVSREAWAGYERSQQPAQMATVNGDNGSGKAKRTVRHQYGDPRFLDIVLKSIEAERQLMGLDAPTKIAPTTPAGRSRTSSG
jgi:hypothetical protein